LDLADKGIASFEEMPGLCECVRGVWWTWSMTKFGNLFSFHRRSFLSMGGGVALKCGIVLLSIQALFICILLKS
jgi:hypothetical protein